MALLLLPSLMAEKDDGLGQEAFETDLTDPKGVEAMMQNVREHNKKMFMSQPRIKAAMNGLFLDMADYGFLKL